MKQALLFITIAFLSFNLQAQASTEVDIVGLLQDEAGEPILGATVVSKQAGVFKYGTSTSYTGIFELISTGDEIEVSYLGYETIKKDVRYFLDHPVITMKQSGIDLEAVVVKAYGGMHRTGCCHCCHLIGSPKSPQPIAINVGLNSTTWQVYPNPTMSSVSVETVFNTGFFSLLSAEGRILKTIPIYDFTTSVDLSEYPAGTYYLRYGSPNSSWVETIGPIVKVKD